MSITVSLINMKGGVGKSTIAVNLAWHYAAYSNWRKRVLVVDLDPQFNASQYLVGANRYGGFLADGKPTIWDIFEQFTRTPGRSNEVLNSADAVRTVRRFTKGGAVEMIPSRLELAYSLKNPSQKEANLAKVLTSLSNNHDLILIDCAPTESLLTAAAYLASDFLLVPVRPEYLSTIGLPLLATSLADFRQQYPTSTLKLAGVVFNAISSYAPEEEQSRREVKKLAKEKGWHIYASEITYSRSYPKGAREGRPIFWTSYARTRQAEKFSAFANEFGKSIGL
jgi:chromosome partitioning protein